MSIEETKEAIRVMQAFVDGKKVEYQISDGTWLVGLSPSWNWPSTRYRIKPTPVQCDGGGEMISELEAAKQRIRLLIAERDTARLQADQQYNLREEFRELLGTDDVEQGVAVVREMKQRIKRLEESVSYWNERYNDLNHKVQNRDNY
jgi:exonuclease VII small subunit